MLGLALCAPGPEPGRHVDHQAYGRFRILSLQRGSSIPSRFVDMLLSQGESTW